MNVGKNYFKLHKGGALHFMATWSHTFGNSWNPQWEAIDSLGQFRISFFRIWSLNGVKQTENAWGCHPICSDLEKNIYQLQLVTIAELPLFMSFQWFAWVAIPSVLWATLILTQKILFFAKVFFISVVYHLI